MYWYERTWIFECDYTYLNKKSETVQIRRTQKTPDIGDIDFCFLEMICCVTFMKTTERELAGQDRVTNDWVKFLISFFRMTFESIWYWFLTVWIVWLSKLILRHVVDFSMMLYSVKVKWLDKRLCIFIEQLICSSGFSSRHFWWYNIVDTLMVSFYPQNSESRGLFVGHNRMF